MQRRTVLRRLGVASAGVAGLSGVGSAQQVSASFEGIDPIDVSDRSGQVPLTELLTSEELTRVGGGIDPTTTSVIVDESQTTLDLSSNDCDCTTGCCECNNPCPDCCDFCLCENCGECNEDSVSTA